MTLANDPGLNDEMYIKVMCNQLHMPVLGGNPLLSRTLLCHKTKL